jgi:CelD/BcsL family acetyltransferase involved in cellulose biosynthesis
LNIQSNLTTTVIREYGEFVALQSEWNELFAAADDAAPTLRHAWVRNAWIEGRRKFETPLVVLVRLAGRLVMAGAFSLGIDRFKPTLTFLKGSLPHNDELLWRPGAHVTDHAVALLETLRGNLSLPRIQRHGRYLDSSPFLGAVSRLGLPVEPKEPWTRFYLATGAFDSYAGYLRSRSKQLRSDHHRRLRRLQETGRFELRREQGEAARPGLVWLLDTKRRWVRRHRKSAPWLKSGEADRFLGRLLFEAGGPPWSLWSLWLDGHRFAGLLSFEERQSWHFDMIGQDPAFGQYSPGRTLNLLAIEQAFAAGIARVAFGTTGDEWKSRLLNGREITLGAKIRIR